MNFQRGDVAEEILKGLDERKDMERKCIEFSRKYDWGIITSITDEL